MLDRFKKNKDKIWYHMCNVFGAMFIAYILTIVATPILGTIFSNKKLSFVFVTITLLIYWYGFHIKDANEQKNNKL